MTVVHKISLRDIGPWAGDHELDLEALGPGLIAVVGPTGCGKSTLLESVLGALYLSCPTRQDPVDLASSRHAQISVDATGDRRFTCRVDLDAQARKSSAVILDDGTPLNDDAKIASYKRNVAAHFPSYELYLATEFAAQGGIGSLLRSPRAMRRRIFADLLGHDRLRRMAEVAHRHARDADVRWKTLAVLVDKQPPLDRAGTVARIEQVEAQLAELTSRKLELVAAAQRCVLVVDADRAQLAEAQRVARERLEAVQLADSLSQQMYTLTSRLAAVDSVLRSSREIIDRGVQLDADRRTLQELVEHGRHLADRALVSDREETTRTAEYREADLTVQRLERQLELCRVKLSTACARRDALANADGPPCVGRLEDATISGCSMVRAYREERAACSRDIAELDSTCRNMSEQLDLAYAARERCSIQQAAVARTAADCRQALDASRDAYRKLKEKIDSTVDGRSSLENADARRQMLQDQLQDVSARHEAAKRRVESCVVVPVEMDVLRTHETAAERAGEALNQIDGQIRDTVEQAAGLRGALRANDERAERAEEVRVEMTVAAADAGEWSQLARGLGPEGVQALMLDAAGPAVSEIACRLLATGWGDRWAVRIDTTRNTDDGRTLEDLDITVLDATTDRERPIEALSGGEAVVVGEALSLALSSYRSNTVPIGTMFRDEAAGALNAETAERYARMLRAFLETGVEQLVFVAHNERLWEYADHVVDVGHGKIEVVR